MKTLRGLWPGLATATAILALCGTVYAQGVAVLRGTVRDAVTKKPVPDVVVTVTSPSLQGEQVVITDGSGQYRIPNLPPGSYVLRLDRETFRPFSQADINLRVGSTIQVNTDLLPEALQAEEIVVVGSAPTVDVSSSTTGVNVNSDFVDRIALNPPSGKGAATRSFESLAEVAPGANADQFGVSISGTTSPENQYVIDGLSVNNPSFGILGTPLSVEFVKEVNVITGGYMPEYGRATGGYLDVVTKTGSNEFHGAVFASITPGAFEGPREQVQREGSTITTVTSLDSLRDIGFEIGGPILKDRLWFYAGLSPSLASYKLERQLNTVRMVNGQPVVEDGFTQTDPIDGTEKTYYATQRSLIYIAKLTLLINQDNTVTLSLYGSPTWSGGDGTFGINPRDGNVEINNGDSGGIINGTYGALAHYYVTSATDTAIKWSSAFDNKRLLFDVTLGWHHEENAVRAADGTALASGEGLSNQTQVFWQRTDPGSHSISDFEATPAGAGCEPRGAPSATICPVTTYYSGGPGRLNESILDRLQGKGVVTSLLQGLGHHVVKAGIDVELMRYASERGLSGYNIFVEDTDGNSFTDFRRFGFLRGPDDDIILEKFDAVSKSTTLGGFLQDSWSIADKVTLNLGLRYDTQLLYGYDGNLAMSLPNQWSPRVGVVYDPTQAGRSKLFASFARFYESVPLDAIDRSIPGERQLLSTHNAATCDPRVPSQQQGACETDQNRVTIGDPFSPNQKWIVNSSDSSPVDPDISPQSSDEIVFGGEVEVIPKASIGLQYTKRYQNRVIEDMSRDEAQTYFIGNPGYGIAKDFPEATRDYDALTVYFQKSYDNLWLAQVSYTLSYLRGNWAGLYRPETHQLDPNINSDFDLVSLLPNRDGPLPGDRTHQIKIFGAKDFILPEGVLINLGGTYRTSSGTPTTYLGSHPIYGNDQVNILPRGAGDRLPWVHSIDARLGVGKKLSENSTLLVTLDVFNVFNFQAETARDQRYTQNSVEPIVDGTPDDLGQLRNSDGTPFNSSDKNPNFGKPIAFQPPRTIRIGAKVTF